MVSKKFNIVQEWSVTDVFYFSSKFNLFWNLQWVCQSRHFLGIIPLDFSKCEHRARDPCGIMPDRAWQRFPGKSILAQKIRKITKNGPKTGFFEFIGNLGQQFLLNLFYNENFYYLLCSCKNPIFRKFCFWDKGQIIFSQSDCRIFQSAISWGQVNNISRMHTWNELIFCM